ncbi:MAG: hypothetical protein AB1690_11265 [Candidatus Zixiibacteriota bacterium]
MKPAEGGLTSLKVKISTPTGPIPAGRGFYQLEEESLYLPVIHADSDRHFFSYLDSETVSLQLDREGRLIFIEVPVPRRRWHLRQNLVHPEKAEPVDIRFIDFRTSFPAPTLFCSPYRNELLIRFQRDVAEQNCYLAENLIAQVSAENRLVAIWAFDILDDLAGREISAWRRKYRVRQQISPLPAVQP